MKMYKLLGMDGKEYLSETPRTFGDNSKLKIYGELDCPSVLSTIKKFPESYEKSRVFLAVLYFFDLIVVTLMLMYGKEAETKKDVIS